MVIFHTKKKKKVTHMDDYIVRKDYNGKNFGEDAIPIIFFLQKYFLALNSGMAHAWVKVCFGQPRMEL